jgi:hypothetical protein
MFEFLADKDVEPELLERIEKDMRFEDTPLCKVAIDLMIKYPRPSFAMNLVKAILEHKDDWSFVRRLLISLLVQIEIANKMGNKDVVIVMRKFKDLLGNQFSETHPLLIAKIISY